MKALLKFFSKEILTPKSKIEEFMEELNRAYRENEPCLEYFVTDFSDQEFQSLYHCLRHYYNLKMDLKVKGLGNVHQRDEYLLIDLNNVFINKNRGFVFKNVDKEVSKEVAKHNHIMSHVIPFNPKPKASQQITEKSDNVIHVDFNKKRMG